MMDTFVDVIGIGMDEVKKKESVTTEEIRLTLRKHKRRRIALDFGVDLEL
jgi:hypothetical protein